MIRVEVQRNPRGEISTLRVQGHAGLAAKGEDIVCAGVSALTQSAVLGLERFLAAEYRFDIEGGFLKISLPSFLDQEDRVRANVILETTVLGIEQIAKNYPRNIKLVTVEDKQD